MRHRGRDRSSIPESGLQLITGESPQDLAVAAAGVLQELQQYGLRVSGAGRHSRYISELRKVAAGAVPPLPARLELWHRAMLELYDLVLAVRVLAKPPEAQGSRARVQETLSGGARRTDEIRHSRARDIQFEVAIATLLRQAEFHVQFAEPDVLASRGSSTFAFAAKRPRSPNKLEKSIRDANDQMIRSCRSGLIAIDISCLVSPADRTVLTRDPSADYHRLSEVAGRFGSRNAVAIRKLVDLNFVFGVLVHVTLPVTNLEDRTLGSVRRWSVTSLVGDHDRRTKALKGLAQRLAGAVSRLTSR
jgi:hypothetical protein